MTRFAPTTQPLCCARSGAAVALLAIASGWGPPAEGSVTRCVDSAGRVSYQNTSCPGGSRGTPVDTTPNQGAQFATREQIQRVKKVPPERELPELRATKGSKAKAREKEALNAGDRRFLPTGITSDEVKRRIGAPDRIAHNASGSGRSRDASQQWIYAPAAADPQTTTVLTLRMGVVTQIERRVTY